jgi:pyrimidine operon attenuation protein/uracil phosphoribosyltransferase
MKVLLDAQHVSTAVDHLYDQVRAQVPTHMPVAIVGIRTRGETLAQRLVDRLRNDLPDVEFKFGALDIGFYRDDLSLRRGMPLVRATEIDFDVEGTWILLVDDVLQTGRSVKAALQAIHDFGRPDVVRLGVLVDRGGRELPIAPDFVGQTIEAPVKARVQVKLKETDGEEGVYILKA